LEDTMTTEQKIIRAQSFLTALEWIATEVIAVQLDQVEGV